MGSMEVRLGALLTGHFLHGDGFPCCGVEGQIWVMGQRWGSGV